MGNLDPWQAQQLLSQYIPFVESALARNFEDAVAFLERYGRIVVKGLSPGHKSEQGLVFLDVRSEEDLKMALDAVGLPALLQRQISGLELFLGSKRDPQFGTVVLFGLGGILVELLGVVAVRACPLTQEDVRDMLEELRLLKLLSGFRGYKLDLQRLYQIISNLCRFMRDHPDVLDVDVNPLFLLKDGTLLAADARITSRQA